MRPFHLYDKGSIPIVRMYNTSSIIRDIYQPGSQQDTMNGYTGPDNIHVHLSDLCTIAVRCSRPFGLQLQIDRLRLNPDAVT